MEHPKFIITGGGFLRLGMVALHRELLLPHEECLGGGFYEFDYVGGKLLLSGKSFDYGPPRWGRVEVLKVPEQYRGLTIVYRDSRGEELDIMATMRIGFWS